MTASRRKMAGWLIAAQDGLLAALIVLSAVTIFTMVITRYVFSYSDASAENISRYLAIWGALIGLATVHRRGLDIRFSLLDHALSPKALKVWRCGLNAACLAFCGFIAWSGWALVAETRMLGEVMQTGFALPLWIPRGAVAVGATLLAIEYAFDAYRIWTGVPRGQDPHVGL